MNEVQIFIEDYLQEHPTSLSDAITVGEFLKVEQLFILLLRVNHHRHYHRQNINGSQMMELYDSCVSQNVHLQRQ